MMFSGEKIKRAVRQKAVSFLNFAYDKNSGEFFGKTCKSWGQTLGFFLVFYTFLAAVFAVHMAVFLSVTPQPGKDSEPANFGRYAYPNYPNAKIGLIAVPGSFSFNGETASLSSSKRKNIRKLSSSANISGVSSHCLDEDTDFGYATGQPCIFLRVMKVFEWSPEAIDQALSSAPILPLSCLPETDEDGVCVELLPQPAGLPLNISNHDNLRSYPFRGKDSDYVTPVMGVLVNLTSLVVPNGVTQFTITITCSVNLTAIGLDDLSAPLSRLYELPSSATTSISVKL